MVTHLSLRVQQALGEPRPLLTFSVASFTKPRSAKSSTSSEVSYYFLPGKDLAASMSVRLRPPHQARDR
jgi:hypothetical protein